MSQLQTISEILEENEGLEGTPHPTTLGGKSFRNQAGKAHSQHRCLVSESSTPIAFARWAGIGGQEIPCYLHRDKFPVLILLPCPQT